MLKKHFSAKSFYISILFAAMFFLVLQIYALHRFRIQCSAEITSVIVEMHSGEMPDDVLGMGVLKDGYIHAQWGILPKIDAKNRKDRIVSDGAGILVVSGKNAVYFANTSHFAAIQKSYRFQILLSILFCLVVMWFSLLFYFFVYRSVQKLEGWVKGYTGKKFRKKKISASQIPIHGFTQIISGIEKIYSDLINTEKAVERKTKLEALGVLFAKVLHDIKNGLASIKIYQYLLRETRDESKRRELMMKMDAGMSDVTVMIQDLLDFVRGSKSTLKEAVRTKDLYNGLKTEYQAKARVEGVKFEISMDDAIAEKSIHVELVRIVTAVKHLIQNAFEEVKAAALTDPEVRVSLKSEGANLLIEIADNGRGIPDEFVDDIFTPFATNGKKNGNGIGAAVAKEYIEAQRGHVEFRTSPAGTVFRITIPFSVSN
ncbi:MAG: HAMP domain-containing histidine kinase [Acidobacteria bacterium]|nr:HAMP domain-containing histidine kinase [Acidobacteriota bacterium]